jgi:transcriptional regulator with XRE-family HTH domain
MPLSDASRRAIETSKHTHADIARGSGVGKSQISRFVSGERGLRVDALEKIAEFLGLEITVRPRSRGKGK